MVDGRRLRSAHAQQRIIEAFLQLLREGRPDPRVAEIANGAGCVSRSIYDHFVTVNGLRGAAIEYALNQAKALAPLVKAGDDRPMRIRAQLLTRAATCERALHLWRLLPAGHRLTDAGCFAGLPQAHPKRVLEPQYVTHFAHRQSLRRHREPRSVAGPLEHAIRPSTGTPFSPSSPAVRNHRNAVRLASESCPQCLGFRRRALRR
jgi:AcrR family transcriptional regulator